MRELRIAPVMTGGTSLAVWMGGATAELYRLLRSAKPAEGEEPDPAVAEDEAMQVYRDLLDLTDTRPVVDVITGTSAGGLNGTLLAAAVRCRTTAEDFLGVRTTWMEVGDIERLLRSAHDPDPPSLLLGDDYFVPQLEALLTRWRQKAVPITKPEDAPDVDVVTTLTTVTGVPNSRSDDFSESISQLDYAQTLRFRKDDFGQEDWPTRLAIAARTSASIPGVFEPSFLPVGKADADASKRPDFTPNASFRRSRWAVDGGVVVNLPLGEALDRIFERTADTEVRRVVLYVSPTPGAAQELAADDRTAPPNLRATLATAITAVRAEGVAADIDLIRRSNEQVERQVRTRRFLGTLVDRVDDGEEFAAYRVTRARSSVVQMLAGVRAATTRPLPMDDERLIECFLGPRLSRIPTDATVPADDGAWSWGIAPVEQASSMVIGLLSRVEPYVPAGSVASAVLSEARQDAHEARDLVGAVRAKDSTYWRNRFDDLTQIEGALLDAGGLDTDDITSWADRAYRDWPGRSDGATDAFADLARAHRMLAEVLDQAAPVVASISDQLQEGDLAANLRAEPEAAALADELSSLLPPGDATGAERIAAIQRRLLLVHVAQTLLLGEVTNREQRVELMQVSWNAWNGLDEDRAPADKLAGPELGRLGAFVKPSWRANDWCWGRMDGAYRLVLLLLDPARLRFLRRHDTSEEFLATMRLEVAALGGGEGPLPAEVEAELETLTARPPKALQAMPRTAQHIARRVQQVIAKAELPAVARAVELSEQLGGNEFRSKQFVKAVNQATATTGKIPDDEVAGLVKEMRIGTEGVGSEFGYGLLNRIGSRIASLVVNAVTGERSGIPALPRLLRPLRVPLQGVTSVVSAITGASVLARALAVFIMAVAGAVVALRLVNAEVPPGTFAVSAILLTGLVVSAMVRSGFWVLGPCFLVVAAVIGLALAGEDVKTVLYDDTDIPTRELDPGTSITAPDGSSIRIAVDGPDGDRLFHDEPIDGEEAEIILGDEGFELREERDDGDPGTAGWKQWGFIDQPVNVFTGLVVLVALAVLTGLNRTKRWKLKAVATLAVAAALVVFGPGFFEDLLTGTPDDTAFADVKDWVADRAEDLEGYDLEVVLVTLVAASLLLTLGLDIVASRRVRAWLAKLRP